MTPEEKLTIIRKQAQEEFVHLSNASHDFPGSDLHKKANWAKEWMDFIEGLFTDDPEFMEDYGVPNRAEWETEARKQASGVNYMGYHNRVDLYIRGFQDGQWWRKNKKE